jgi:hypothetical protein
MSESTARAATPIGDDQEVARRRATRRRTLYVLGAISVGWKVLVFTVGAALPQWLVTDGVSELPASHRAYGTASLATARALFDTPAERLGRVVQRVRVVSVDSVAGRDTSRATAAGGAGGCVLGARVRAYTYFAIPYSEVRTRCEHGVIEYRLFRPKTRVD